MITDGPHVHSKTEVEPLARNNKISPSNSIQGLLFNRDERLMSNENENEKELLSSENDREQKLALLKVNELTKTTIENRNIFEKGTPKSFLKNVSFSIHLSELMKVKSCCLYHQTFNFAPVLTEIVHPQLQTHYKGRYLLQILSNQGEVLYLKALQYEIETLNAFMNQIMYILNPSEQQEKCIYIIFRIQTGYMQPAAVATIKVKNLIKDKSFNKIGIRNNRVYIANNNEVRMVDISYKALNLKANDELEVDVEKESLKVFSTRIPEPLKIHQFFTNGLCEADTYYIMVLIELEDNQMKTERLYWWGEDQPEDKQFEWIAYRENFLRAHVRNDPIVSFKQFIDVAEFQFGIALRKSGKVDLYYNYAICKDSDDTMEDIEVTFGCIWGIKRPKPGQDCEIFKINCQELKGRISFEFATHEGDVKDSKWQLLRFEGLKNYIKLFSAMVLCRLSYLIAHTNVLSIYNMISQLWVDHIEFPAPIKHVLRIQDSNKSDCVIVILENQEFFKLSIVENGIKVSWEKEKYEIALEGKLTNVHTQLKSFQQHILQTTLEDGTGLLYRFAQFVDTQYMGDLSKINVKVARNETVINFKNGDNHDYIIHNNTNNTLKFFPHDDSQIVDLTGFYLPYDTLFAVSFLDVQCTQVLFITKANVVVLEIDWDTKKVSKQYQTDTNQYANCQLIDDEYLYFIQERTDKAQSGLYVQSLDTFFKANKAVEEGQKVDNADKDKPLINFQLKSALGGVNNMLMYYGQEERIAFMSDFQTIKLVPILHRAVITFFGMRTRSHYLSIKKVKDVLIALDTEMRLTTWNVTSGKLLYRKLIKNGDELKNYSVFKTEQADMIYSGSWYQNNVVLINKTESLNDLVRKEYFGKRYLPGINGGQTILDLEALTFYPFKVIRIIDSQHVDILMEFDHAIWTHCYQKMYLSDDLEYMLERERNHMVFLYKRQPVEGSAVKVTWEIVKKLEFISPDICDITAFNFLFTPSLQYYLDFNVALNKYFIKRSADQLEIVELDPGYLSPETDKPDELVKRFKWVSNSQFKVINYEGFEKTFDISAAIRSFSKRKRSKYEGIAVVGQNKVPMMDFSVFGQKVNFYEDMHNIIFQSDQTMPRLVRKVQNYYSALSNLSDFKLRQLQEVLYSIDMSPKPDSKVFIELSFTFLNWKLAESLSLQASTSVQYYDIAQLTNPRLRELCLNIFPGGNTVLHYLYNQPDELKNLYSAMSATNEHLTVQYQIPFIKNFEGLSPMHKCLNEENYQAINQLLLLIKDDPIDNHSRAIVDILHQLVESELPGLKDYLKTRMIQTQQLKTVNRGILKKKQQNDYQVHTTTQWCNINQLKADALETNASEARVIEKMLDFKIFDFPEIHCFQEERSRIFFNSLSKVQSIGIFESEAIQALIDYKWPLVKMTTVIVLFIPFLIYLGLFIVFSNVFNGQLQSYAEEDKQEEIQTAKKIIIACLFFLSAFSMLNELYQLKRAGIKDYFGSVWNILDVSIPVMVSVVLAYHLHELNTEGYERPPGVETIHSLCSLMLWIKFLYFLRIFRHTAYLINMINTVIYDMRIFLLILLIIYLGFGEAFLRLSERSDPEVQWLPDYAHGIIYSFRLSIGDTDTDPFDDSVQKGTAWFLFILCALYTNVVMLNLLIAIISESFDKINSNAQFANYQERARLIAENSYLIPGFIKAKYSPLGLYLIKATELIDENLLQDEERDIIVKKVNVKIEALQDLISLMTRKMDKNFLNNRTDRDKQDKTTSQNIRDLAQVVNESVEGVKDCTVKVQNLAWNTDSQFRALGVNWMGDIEGRELGILDANETFENNATEKWYIGDKDEFVAKEKKRRLEKKEAEKLEKEKQAKEGRSPKKE